VILIDPPEWWHRERWWGHMVSDHSFEELHEFAARLGIPHRAFDRDHYDIPAHAHAAAIAAGAALVSSKELVTRLAAAGLRRPKHLHRPAGGEPVA
jgi:hypothetical protein